MIVIDPEFWIVTDGVIFGSQYPDDEALMLEMLASANPITACLGLNAAFFVSLFESSCTNATTATSQRFAIYVGNAILN